MNEYLIDTKYAVEELIRLIREEENQIINLRVNLESQKKTYEIFYDDFMRKELDLDENFTEGQYISSFYRQAKFKEEVIEPLRVKTASLESSLNNKKHSIDFIAGAVLQIAKQGISIVYKGLDNCPDGRTIKNGVALKEIIWHGRNQAMHYEEKIKNSSTISCFNKLGYSRINDINLAKEIIDLLGWKTYRDFEIDMISLLK